MQQITCCPTSEIEQQIMLAESKMCNSEEIFNPRFLEKNKWRYKNLGDHE